METSPEEEYSGKLCKLSKYACFQFAWLIAKYSLKKSHEDKISTKNKKSSHNESQLFTNESKRNRKYSMQSSVVLMSRAKGNVITISPHFDYTWKIYQLSDRVHVLLIRVESEKWNWWKWDQIWKFYSNLFKYRVNG